MVSRLPFEILIHISNSLSTEDQLSCALTCKTWRYPFQKALWKNIQICTYQSMQKIIDSIKASQNVLTAYPFLVHSLHIRQDCYMTEMTDINLYDLFRHLPNIKRLDLGDIDYRDMNTEIEKSKETWKSLEVLKIRYKGTEDKKRARHFFKLINTCSMLKEIEILHDECIFRIKFGVNEFDKLHQNLQSLSSFKVNIYLTPNLSVPMDTIPDTIPAFPVTSVEINSKEYRHVDRNGTSSHNTWDPWWLYYFCHKYPNLRYLKLHVAETHHTLMYLCDKKKLVSLVKSTPNAFRHLEAFELTTNGYFEHSDFILWELLYPLRAPLKHLALDGTEYEFIDDRCPMDVKKIYDPFLKHSRVLYSRGLSMILWKTVRA
ncbi:hypothetical protein J3Q64DRAFT_1699236 [Phycomyces blakesleeanus]|uniref:F-box domain-containing protein n=2 Tax=Phycomyces blakesleeanus TaxID=4837 RepID=A0A163AHL7_PHYB8|nr:hypothetical protein PHYBLDRAFT_168885 [Phycomyces blakesleeanus NRRL 1555(-)]OAD73541.1 hypothetical protein PHYBLDRAFT_168885 [Phycomyces blakesleeanus NRRL 1555(-)]|eukprot:XP_018291581.1 hypothetical protein PHYBLDRAFT_168885 [Phycomyces blakesleeanus NRRL 1555(-)]